MLRRPTPDVPHDASPEGLVGACRDGDRDAFGRLFELYRDRVYSIAWHLCQDRAAAADVTQDVFAKLLVRLPQFRGASVFTTWLHRVAVNAALDHRRGGGRSVPIEEAEARPSPRLVDLEYLRADRRARIRAAILRLPPKLRAPIVLRHVEGLRYDEISSALRISTGTVASRLSRAHARLARELEDLR